MNAQRRETIRAAMRIIEGAVEGLTPSIDIITNASESEQDVLESLPGNLLHSDRAFLMEHTISVLDKSEETITEVVDSLKAIVAELRGVIV